MQNGSERIASMKLGLDKPTSKKAMRVATVLTGVTACAAAFAPAATAQVATSGAPAQTKYIEFTGGAHLAPANARHHLRIAMAPRIVSVAVCEYAGFRQGNHCDYALHHTNGRWIVTTPSPDTYAGHIVLIWNPANFHGFNGTATATPGHWNQCTLPSGSGTIKVTAENNLPNCLR
jgi:hypothetical protein